MADSIGAKIGVDGEPKYREQLNRIIAKSKELASEMKLVESSFNSNTTAEEKATAKTAVLNKQIANQREYVELLKQKLDQLTADYGENNTAVIKQQETLNKAETALNSMQKELEDTTKDLDNAGDETKNLGNALDKTGDSGSRFKDVFKAGLVKDIAMAGLRKVKQLAEEAARAFVEFAKKSVKLASDLTEVQNVVDVTFGTGAKQINDFAKSAATNFGISELAAKKFTGQLGAMLKSSGVVQTEALSMSQSLAGLAGDIASFYNLDTEEAFEKIKSGMAGMIRPLRDLGINMSVANLSAFALSQGIDKSYQSMTEAEKMTLRYQYLMKATADAQGDFVRTSDNLANQQRILELNVENLSAAFGKKMIPAVTEVAKDLNDLVTGEKSTSQFLDSATKKVGSLVKVTSKAMRDMAVEIRKNSGEIGAAFADLLETAANESLDTLPDVVDMILETAISSLEKFGSQTLPNLIPKVVETVFDVIVDVISDAPQLLDMALAIVEGVVKGVFNAIPKAAKGIIDAFAAAFAPGEFGIKEKVQDELNDITGAVEEWQGTITDANTTLADTTAEIEAQALVAEKLVSRYEELQRKEALTVVESAELSSIVAQLNAMFPNLSLVIDETTGKANLNADSIRSMVDEYIRAAMAQAYMKRIESAAEELIDANEELAKATEKVKDAEEKIRTAQNKSAKAQEVLQKLRKASLGDVKDYASVLKSLGIELDDNFSNYGYYCKAVRALNDIIIDSNADVTAYQDVIAGASTETQNWENRIADLEGQCTEWANKATEYSNAAAGFSDAMGGASGATGELAANMDVVELGAYELELDLEALGLAAEDLQNRYTELAGVSQNAFERMQYDSALTAQQLTDNLNSNAEMTERYGAAIKTLAGRFTSAGRILSDEFIQVLKDAGPTATLTLENLVGATDDQLIALQEAFDRGGTAAVEALIGEIGNGEVPQAGGQMVDDTAKKIETDTKMQTAAKRQVVQIKTAMLNTVAQSNFATVGSQMISGVISGLESQRKRLLDKVSSLLKAARSRARITIDAHSPSKVWEKDVGLTMGQGTGVGFLKGLEEYQKQIEQAISPSAWNFGDVTSTVSPASMSATYGDVNLTVYGAEGQNVSELADIVMDRIESAVQRKGAVFA